MSDSLITLCLVAMVLPLACARAATFYVAPDGDDNAAGTSKTKAFASLPRARDAVLALKKAGRLARPVTVHLRGGVHTIAEPVVFTPEDSGTEAAPIVYTALEGERPVLHGDRRITGWKPADDKPGAWVAEAPWLKGRKLAFRQLYVNGTARRRARTPKEGFLRVAGFPEGTCKTVNYHTDCQSFEFKPGDIDPAWTNLDDVEVIVYHFWTDSHLPIQSIDPKTHIVTFKHKAGKVFTDDFTTKGARYVAEHVFEALDQPGEWYLNRKTGRLYYIPMPGEDMAKAEVVAAVKFNGLAWSTWQKGGKDRHSVYADPLFVDPAQRDFRPKPGSPALALGFEPIDLTGVGPRYDPDEGARVLAARPPHPGLRPDPALPDDTRLWAALQQASGGTWGGCVYDCDAILAALRARDR